MFHLGFFSGFALGFFTALLLLYLIRSEMEKVANGERILHKRKENKDKAK